MDARLWTSAKVWKPHAEGHLATAARKLGTVNRTHAAAVAIRQKINPA
jgi:hypothetical protein